MGLNFMMIGKGAFRITKVAQKRKRSAIKSLYSLSFSQTMSDENTRKPPTTSTDCRKQNEFWLFQKCARLFDGDIRLYSYNCMEMHMKLNGFISIDRICLRKVRVIVPLMISLSLFEQNFYSFSIDKKNSIHLFLSADFFLLRSSFSSLPFDFSPLSSNLFPSTFLQSHWLE